jgi:hypothetical protein
MILESFGFSTRKTIATKINRRIVLKLIRMTARSGFIFNREVSLTNKV